MTSRIPPALNLGKSHSSIIRSLWVNWHEHKDLIESGEALFTDTAERYACGYPIHDFQRQVKWSEGMMVSFIENLWLGVALGYYVVHSLDFSMEHDGNKPRRFSGSLIDGQQRLTAIEKYWRDEFKVFGLYFSELDRAEHLRFMQIKFPHYEATLWDEAKICDLYNSLAFGGVAHEDNERAVPGGK